MSSQIQKKKFNRILNSLEKFTSKNKWYLTFLSVIIILLLTIYANWSDVKNVNSFLKVIINNLGNIAIPTATVRYLLEARDRKDRKIYEALQVLDSSSGIETSYARLKALQDLNNENVSLQGIDLPNANLSDIELENIDLQRGNLKNVKFEKAI
jgi:uncharacterized protein YjbI with pentapeptide repeats